MNLVKKIEFTNKKTVLAQQNDIFEGFITHSSIMTYVTFFNQSHVQHHKV